MNDCMGRGECNRLTGLCICDPGFGAPDCSVIEGDENELDTTILEAINKDQSNEKEPLFYQEEEESPGEETLTLNQLKFEIKNYFDQHIGELDFGDK